jgi:translocator protein
MAAPLRFRVHPFLLFLLASFLTMVIAAFATSSTVGTWYPTLRKPPWTPPNWLFGPVWFLLYIGMAYAAWRVWRVAEDLGAHRTFRLFRTQLALNALWPVLFFALRKPGWALIDIAVLWGLLGLMTVWFWRLDRIAGVVWGCYYVWVTYAFALNAAIWNMNR